MFGIILECLDMKKIFSISLLSISCLLYTACGVDYRLIEVQALRPAVNAVSFTDKNLAVFISLYADGTPEQYTLRNDSLVMNEIGIGMKEAFENSILFTDYEVPVYSLYFYCDSDTCDHNIDDEYLQSLRDETDSQIFIIVDSLWTAPDISVVRQYDSDYGYYFYGKTAVPFEIKISLYDAVKKEYISQKHYADTLVWDQADFYSLQVVEDIPSVTEAVYLAAYEIGKRYTNTMIPYWENMRRFYVVPYGEDWRRAADLTYVHDWEGAMNIWKQHASSNDNKLASYAAFNTALACEMLGHYDLALEWLYYARTKYYFAYINGYIELLENRKSDSKELQKQLEEIER